MTGAVRPVVKTSLFMRFPHFMCEWGKVLLLQCHRNYQLCVSLSLGARFISRLSQTHLWLDESQFHDLRCKVFLVDALLSLYHADPSGREALDYLNTGIMGSNLSWSVCSYFLFIASVVLCTESHLMGRSPYKEFYQTSKNNKIRNFKLMPDGLIREGEKCCHWNVRYIYSSCRFWITGSWPKH
jgi:hypothetical protein